MEKARIAKYVFQVVDKEFITPGYIRVTLNGEGANEFSQCTIGANNKIFIPSAGKKNVLFDELEKPIVRTYTHRGVNVTKSEIVIDFVNHGDNGPASLWARSAVFGDELGVAMKVLSKELVPHSDWYFLIGDATAIPVLTCILESLAPEAKGYCIIEVASPDDVHPEVKHAGFVIKWIYNSSPEKGSKLNCEMREIIIPKTLSRFAFVACEYDSVKKIRNYFRKELNWKTNELYAFSYWKAGEAENKSVGERRSEKRH